MPQLSATHLQGSDTRVRTPKNPAGFFWWAHLKNPVKKPPISIMYLTFIFSHQLDICMQIAVSAMHNTNRMLNTTV